MSKDFQIIKFTLDEETIKKMDGRLRSQIVGCMHAHNELAVLNRVLLFSENPTGDGEHYGFAESVQQWCFLQVLVGKLVETWKMLNDRRFFKENSEDPAIGQLKPKHKDSLKRLKDYFSVKKSALGIIRDKTAFHYDKLNLDQDDKLNLDQTVNGLAQGENTIYLAQHPANSLYYMGSALVFRSVFAMIADAAHDPTSRSYDERTIEGRQIAIEGVKDANYDMHLLLHGLIETLLDKVLPQPLDTLDQVPINIRDAPDPKVVQLPTFIDIGNT